MKYFLGFLGIVALVIVVFVLVVRGFTTHSETPKTSQSSVADYANTSTVMRFTIEGPIVADPQYHEMRITIGRDANTIEVTQGYQHQVVKAQTYPNNVDAYTSFLRALQLLGYTRGLPNSGLDDERGYCPSGSRYVYEIVSGATDVQRYWVGTCGVGTFKGSSPSIRNLFERQIPDYSSFVHDYSING